MFWTLFSTIVLLFFSFIFSGSEAALFSLPDWRIQENQRIKELISQPRRLLGTLLLGNLLVNISATAIFTLFLLYLSRDLLINKSIIIGGGGIVLTVILLLFGEITPKIIATRNPNAWNKIFLPFIAFCNWLFSPLTWALNKINTFATLFPEEPTQLTAQELHTMITFGREQGVLLAGEEEILRNLIELDKRTVSEVMTPRKDIVAVPATATIATTLTVCRQSGFSRLPVYSENLDQITGIVYAKDLLTATGLEPSQPVTTITRAPYFIPEVKRLSSLLDELRRKNSHIAIVIDEFGQTAGLVTLEDILEAIFGEISDEFDHSEELPYHKIADGTFLVDGDIDIATLNRLFDNAFAGIDFDRLSSFIHDRLGRLPRTDDTFNLGNLKITVVEVSKHRLEKVLIKKIG
jgi:putative hemolysin